MKLGLIVPSNIWFAPFVNIYVRLLQESSVDYDIISWNRDGSESNKGLQFEKRSNSQGLLSKMLSYQQFASFVKKTIRKNHYDKLIVFCPQIAIFISRFLEKHYKGRYIFDYRDLSIEQKWYFKQPFLRVLRNSFANVISSPGFKRCLPKGFDYLLSHNFNIDVVRSALNSSNLAPAVTMDEIKVLTIGGIRDYSSNIEVVKSLANKDNFRIQFVGKGAAAKMIEEYAVENNIKNIEFEGYYPKEKEAGYIKEASFLNIFYPRKISHDTALSNRFYNALIYHKPMLVTTNSTQGDYVEHYQLGLSLDSCEKLDVKIRKYLQAMDYAAFSKRCDNLLEVFLKDYDIWKAKVIEFVKGKHYM